MFLLFSTAFDVLLIPPSKAAWPCISKVACFWAVRFDNSAADLSNAACSFVISTFALSCWLISFCLFSEFATLKCEILELGS